MIYTKDFLKNASVGDFTYGSLTVYPPNPTLESKITIGRFCSFADGITLSFHSNHSLKDITTYPFDSLQSEGWPSVEFSPSIGYKPIIIENDVWVGYGCQILQGSHISNGCIIGAFSVVRGYLPPYSVCIGNPAQIIKKRFSDEDIEKLLQVKWWDWPTEKIKENLQVICSQNVLKLVAISLMTGHSEE